MKYHILSLLILLIFSGCSAFGNRNDIDLGYKVYVPGLSGNNITIIPATNSNDTTMITLARPCQFLARVPHEDMVFALLSGGNEITEITPTTDAIGETFRFEVGSTSPQVNYRVIFTTNGQKAYFATSYVKAGVAVMRVSDRTFQQGIDLNSTSISNFVITPDGSLLYCIDPAQGKIHLVNTATDTLIRTIEVEEDFSLAEYNSSSGKFYMVESGRNATVKEFDPETNDFVNRIENVTDNVVKLKVSRDGETLYVLGSDELVVISTQDNSIQDRTTLEYRSPSDFQFLPNNEYILIPSSQNDVLMVLEPEFFNTEAVIDTGDNPGEILILDL